jgi:hypothetical protein
MLLLPFALATGLSLEQLAAVLTHELAHLRRYDPLVNLVQRLVEAALFFHPAVWYVSRLVSHERELCCDDLVLAAGVSRQDYAEALILSAELSRSETMPAAAVGVAATGHRPSALRRRVLRVLGAAEASPVRLTRSGVLLLGTALAAVALTGVLSWPRPDAQANDTQPAAPPPAPASTVQRVRELLYVLRYHRVFSRSDQWAGAVRELIEIGKPAVPELVAELDRTDHDAELRALGFVLRGIGDVRAVPALIRAIPRTLRPGGLRLRRRCPRPATSGIHATARPERGQERV